MVGLTIIAGMAIVRAFSGKTLKRARIYKGLGRLKLAKAINFAVTPDTIKRYEDGLSVPRLDVAEAMAFVLGIQVSDLMEDRNAESR